MTMVCKCCTSPDRLNIDREIVQGGNLADISRRYAVPYDSLWVHSREHIARQLAQVYEKRQLAEKFDLLGKIDNIISRAERIFRRNYAAGKDNTALKALESQRSTIDMLARISYSLHQAKLAEVELLRQTSGEYDQQKQEEFQEGLKILTIPELKMFQRLQEKILNQSNEIIIPENSSFTSILKHFHDQTDGNTRSESQPAQKLIRTIEPEQKDDISRDIVQPIQPEQISVCPWDEYPLNPKYHLNLSKKKINHKSV